MAYSVFECAKKCTRSFVSSGLVTIDSTLSCRSQNQKRKCPEEVADPIRSRLLGFRHVSHGSSCSSEESTTFTYRSIYGHEVCIDAFSFEEGVPVRTVYRLQSQLSNGISQNDPDHGGARSSHGTTAAGDGGMTMVIRSWFESVKQPSDRQPNVWNSKDGGVLYKVDEYQKNDVYNRFVNEQLATGSVRLVDIPSKVQFDRIWAQYHTCVRASCPTNEKCRQQRRSEGRAAATSPHYSHEQSPRQEIFDRPSR